MQKKHALINLFILPLLLASSHYALALPFNGQYYLSGSVGRVTTDAGKAQTANLDSIGTVPLSSQFSVEKNSPVFDVGLQGGVQFTFKTPLRVQLGAGLYQSQGIDVSGKYFADGSTSADANYNYQVNNVRLMLSATALYQASTHWLPYVSAGIGYGQLQINNFSIGKTPTTQVSNLPQFANHNTWRVMSQLGAGIRYQLDKECFASLGYDMIFLGNSDTGLSDTPIRAKLSVNNITLNRLALTLGYLF
jgi:opacity protein-like surface antigen